MSESLAPMGSTLWLPNPPGDTTPLLMGKAVGPTELPS